MRTELVVLVEVVPVVFPPGDGQMEHVQQVFRKQGHRVLEVVGHRDQPQNDGKGVQRCRAMCDTVYSNGNTRARASRHLFLPFAVEDNTSPRSSDPHEIDKGGLHNTLQRRYPQNILLGMVHTGFLAAPSMTGHILLPSQSLRHPPVQKDTRWFLSIRKSAGTPQQLGVPEVANVQPRDAQAVVVPAFGLVQEHSELLQQ